MVAIPQLLDPTKLPIHPNSNPFCLSLIRKQTHLYKKDKSKNKQKGTNLNRTNRINKQNSKGLKKNIRNKYRCRAMVITSTEMILKAIIRNYYIYLKKDLLDEKINKMPR